MRGDIRAWTFRWYYRPDELTYLRSWALPQKLPIVQPFRKFSAILRNPKVHHRVHKSPPLVPILSQFDPVSTIPSFLSKIHFNIIHPPASWSSQWSLSFWLPHQYPICIPRRLLIHFDNLPEIDFFPCSSWNRCSALLRISNYKSQQLRWWMIIWVITDVYSEDLG
jgi:hypothetical protein